MHMNFTDITLKNGVIPGYSLAQPLPWQQCLLAYAAGLAAWQSLPAASLAFLLLLLLLPEIRGLRLVAALGFLLLGVVVTVILAPPPAPQTQAWMQDRREVLVQGTVAVVEQRSEGRLRLTLEELSYRHLRPDDGDANWSPLQGKLLWSWYNSLQTPAPGSQVQVALRVRPMRGMANEDLWDYEGWQALRGVRYKAWSRAGQGEPQFEAAAGPLWWRWRQALRQQVVERLHPQDSQARAMVFALLFGERFWLEEKTRELFRDGGVAHSLALSGLHVGMVTLLGFLLARALGWPAPGLFERLPRQKLGALLGAMLALVYIWLGGWSPSLLRAGLMFFFWGILYIRGRENCIMDGLFMALAVILAIEPMMLFDLRLQLSLVAVAGIAVLLEFTRRVRLCAGGVRWWLAMLLMTSIAAQLAVMPLVAWNFGKLAASFWLNALWLPVLGVVVLPCALAGLVAATFPLDATNALAEGLFSLAAAPAEGFLALLHWLQEHELLPTFRVMRAGWPGQLGCWLALLLFALTARRRLRGGESPQNSMPGNVAAALALAVLLLSLPGLRAASQTLDKGVRLRMLDVGQGQSLLLELPGGRRLLLDGGGFPFGTFDIGDAIIAPALTAHRPPMLEWMVLSHADSDHSFGLLTPLREMTVKRFASSGRLASEGGANLAAILRKKSTKAGIWQAGDVIELARGLKLHVLHPAAGYDGGSDNENSLALRLVWQGRGLALMPGDLQERGLRALLDSGQELQAEALVLPHHGGWSEGVGALLLKSRPLVALASAGYLNRYGFPAAGTLRSARQLGVPVLDTASLGAVTVNWGSPQDRLELTTVKAGVLKAPKMSGRRP